MGPISLCANYKDRVGLRPQKMIERCSKTVNLALQEISTLNKSPKATSSHLGVIFIINKVPNTCLSYKKNVKTISNVCQWS